MENEGGNYVENGNRKEKERGSEENGGKCRKGLVTHRERTWKTGERKPGVTARLCKTEDGESGGWRKGWEK